MKKKETFVTYCTGCGLCKSVQGVSFHTDEKGYNIPELEEAHLDFCANICPAGGAASEEMLGKNVWGNYQQVKLGWAMSRDIRREASSGGMLTALCCYLLESGKVDGIIQTKVSEIVVHGTETIISRTRDEVLACMGSRYSISSPLDNIKQIVKEGERYAFVGKPCDASALRMYMKQDEKLSEQIKYILSFFCAGQPSVTAQKRLLNELGCKEEECVSLQYRGNGWPGYATATKKDGSKMTMSYNDSWGKILGRDVRKACRFCLDGIGEFADVSCGDAWYLTEQGTPNFMEAEGRNVIFARTKQGEELVNAAAKTGDIFVENYQNDIKDLEKIQRYQLERRATMEVMLRALRMAKKEFPNYNKKTLRGFAQHVTRKLRIKRFLGTVRRVVQGKI